MITSSIRLPLRLHARLKELAAERGIGLSTLVREWLEAAIAELDDDQLISRAEARMALARLHAPRRAG
ncbi:toxin-antitoxin system HicB family antitoxin [Nocardia blacklockiae]|nr:toxin-antitoxin system HicB family antitoxin [Nocardia blacklockiae]